LNKNRSSKINNGIKK